MKKAWIILLLLSLTPTLWANLNHKLFDAVQNNNLKRVERLIRMGASVHARLPKGIRPLHMAILYGHTKMVRLLLAKGASVHDRVTLERGVRMNKTQLMTPLHIAAHQGYYEIAEQLVSHGAFIDSMDVFHNTPLHYASSNYHLYYYPYNTKRSNHLKLIKLLIDHGALVHARNVDGWTPLHYACQGSRSPENVKYLIDHGADVNSQDRHGDTPFHVAVFWYVDGQNRNPEQLKTIHLLLKHKARMNTLGRHGESPLFRVMSVKLKSLIHKQFHQQVTDYIKSGLNINERDSYGMTWLHWASQFGFKDTIRLLVKNGGHINAQDFFGRTPLNYADDYPSNNDIMTLIKSLGGRKSIDYELLNAVSMDQYEKAVELIKKGSNVNAIVELGLTPMDQVKSDRMKKLILKAGGRKSLTYSLLDAIRKRKHLRVAQLIRKGADVHSQFTYWTAGYVFYSTATYLHLAAEMADHHCFQLFARNYDGLTAVRLSLTLDQVAVSYSLPNAVLARAIGAAFHLLTSTTDAERRTVPLIDHAPDEQVPKFLCEITRLVLESLVPIERVCFQGIHPQK
mgnify:CR=1 FL=1